MGDWSLVYDRCGITIHVKKKRMMLEWLTTHRYKQIKSLPQILGKSKFQEDERSEYENKTLKCC